MSGRTDGGRVDGHHALHFFSSPSLRPSLCVVSRVHQLSYNFFPLSLSSFFLSVPSLEPLSPESTQHNKTALISAAPKDTAAAAMSELDSAICGAVA